MSKTSKVHVFINFTVSRTADVLKTLVEIFRVFAGDRTDVRLLVVGARYTRDYEIQYVEEVKIAINGDPRIELYDVTENVDSFYEVISIYSNTRRHKKSPKVSWLSYQVIDCYCLSYTYHISGSGCALTHIHKRSNAYGYFRGYGVANSDFEYKYCWHTRDAH